MPRHSSNDGSVNPASDAAIAMVRYGPKRQRWRWFWRRTWIAPQRPRRFTDWRADVAEPSCCASFLQTLALCRRALFIEKETPMNKDQAAGKWQQVKGKLKEQWGKLTDDDLTILEGSQDRLAGKIQERYGIAKEEAERQVREFRERNRDVEW
jgi:uncharacterized protein YjbJ (UPF0337 family)